MAVTIVSVVAISETVFDVNFSSDLGGTPTFYIYQNGVFITQTTATVWRFTAQSRVSLIVDILDTADLPGSALTGYATIAWPGDSTASHYRVEKLVSSAWTLQQRVQEENKGSYSWRSGWLEDETTHQFRVISVGTNDEQASPRQFSILIVRNPDPVLPTLTFNDADRTLTVEAV